jgi:glutaconate CoA-transferase subunit A
METALPPGNGVILPYDDLRRQTRERDRSLREKVMSLDEAAALVPDGASIGIGVSTLSRTPLAMIWALIRAGRRDLVCARGISSSEGELLFASGASRHLITSWFSLGIVWGVSRIMRAYTETGRARFEEWSHLAMGLRFRAGAMGVPFLPMRSMLGSDVLTQLPDARVIDCPFTGEKLVLVPALNPDFALIHVQRCDAYGNAQIDGLPFMDLDLALAANRVILTTERIVSNDQIRRRPDQTKIPFLAVDAVVEAPFGCAPHECYGAYEPLFDHLNHYAAALKPDAEHGIRDYLSRYFYEPASWTDYLDRIGLAELIDAARRGKSIYDD